MQYELIISLKGYSKIVSNLNLRKLLYLGFLNALKCLA